MLTESQLRERLDAGLMIESPEQMTDEYRSDLIRTLTVSGDTELVSVPSYYHAAERAPSLNSKISALAIIQDEMSHAHIAYRLLEDLGDLGDDHREEGAEHERADDEHGHRVDHGGHDLGAEARLALGEVGQADQHHVERAGGLAGPDHVDEEAVEDARVGGQGVGQRGALVDPLLHVGDDALQPLVLHLVDQPLIRPADDVYFLALEARYRSVRRFLPDLLKHIRFGSSPAGRGVPIRSDMVICGCPWIIACRTCLTEYPASTPIKRELAVFPRPGPPMSRQRLRTAKFNKGIRTKLE